ncbi:type II secretion system minor pseudopilin GspH [Pseudomonas sp. LRF_L74]|uniref:type II secretion system minor pseudopilin GspH n=1 Tax=Pseudomonas sp. LRF_L74 TaxID=3369422 RepID=UPI003F6101C9
MRRARGFTLIELLVVLVILGVLVGVAVLGSGIADSPARKLDDEAERLGDLLRVLLDEAVLDNREYGVRFDRQTYQVLRYDAPRSRWRTLDDKVHVLPDWVEVRIELDEQAVTLPVDSDKQRADDSKQPGKDRDTDSRVVTSAPQLLILSSGEYTPFRLRLASRERGGPALVLSSDGFSDPLIEAEQKSGARR